ncbi:MAG: hypothetical protein AAFY56_00885 [Pseudomonadota bacterium]
MSSSKPLAILALMLSLALGGCWLKPLYGPQGGASGPVQIDLASIDIVTDDDELDHILRNQLANDLNPGGLTSVGEAFTLDVNPRESTNALLIQLDDTISRFDLTVAADYTLRRRSDDRIVLRSSVRRVASYNVVDDTYATLVARRDAQRRASAAVSRAIRTNLALYFRDEQT